MKPSSAVNCVGVVLLLISVGCTKPSTSPSTPAGASSAPSAPAASDRDAIAQAIQQHLSNNKSINMAVMDMNLTDVSINGDQAQANAEFRLKQGGASMAMTYFLQRHAGGWIVVRNQPGGGQFAHPPMDQTHTGAAPGSGQMPMPNVNDFFNKTSPHEANGSPSQK
jgi:hypothetical protein